LGIGIERAITPCGRRRSLDRLGHGDLPGLGRPSPPIPAICFPTRLSRTSAIEGDLQTVAPLP
jgi:hypothetical protein